MLLKNYVFHIVFAGSNKLLNVRLSKRLSSLGRPEKARQIPSQLLAAVLKLIGPLFSSEDVEKDFFFFFPSWFVAAPLVYMSWPFCMAVVKKMFLHQERGPNVSVTLPCRSRAAARGQVMPVELAGLFSGKHS